MMIGKTLRASLVGACAFGSAVAQTHVIKKPESVVRAVGVYEWTGSETKPTASRFVPVTLFIDGHLEDAAVYLARPVPFALQTGTIFELEHAGVPQGTLELAFARHEIAPGDTSGDDAWLGFGQYKPLVQKKEAASTLRAGKITPIEVSGGKSRPSFSNQPSSGKPAATPSTSTTTDNSTDPDRPTLTRKPGNPSDKTSDAKTTTSSSPTPDTASDADRPTMKRSSDSTAAASATADTSSTATTTASSDPDRPTMKRPASDSASAGKPVDDERAPEADPERPTLRKRTEAQRQAARKEHDSSSVVGGNTSLNDDPDRPSLHRGKPAGALDGDDLPALQGFPPDVHRAVGVSDAANRPEHNFERAWDDEAERTAVLGKMQEAARALLAGYSASASAQATSAPAAPAHPASSSAPAVRPVQRTVSIAQRKADAAKAAAKDSAKTSRIAGLSEEQLHGYTLSYGGAATYVYSATSAGANGALRYVSLVAQREPNGELRTALSNVTDSAHLDRTPRLTLVDAVDVEASNRASLLFELRAQNSRQFAFYRVIGAQAQEIFGTGSTN